ncbi:MAG: hypothetical protein IKT27_03065 [Clostridia bacterium]|nr:hypothetical protein [Clostridia bacterium]
MALSGSFKTTGYNGRYLLFTWVATQNVSGSKSTIQWTLRGAGVEDKFYTGTNFKVVIDGETVTNSSAKISLGSNTVVASGTKTISHLTDGTRSFSVSASAAIGSTTTNCSGSATFTLDKLPVGATLLTISEFNDENNPTITYKNPDGNNVSTLQVAIGNGAGEMLIYKNLNKTGTSYTFNFTDAERELLRSQVKYRSTTGLTVAIITTTGTEEFYSSQNVVFTIKNGTPTLNPVVFDTNAISTQLTGNPQTIIKHYNDMSFTANAAARKGATITSISVENGGSKQTTDTGKFSNTDDNLFLFSVTDSRNNTTTKSITLPMVDYVPLTCSVSAEIALSDSDSTKSDIRFVVSGNYFKKSFGAETNYLNISYKIKNSSGQVINEEMIGTDNSMFPGEDNTYEYEEIRTDFDYQDTYTVEVEVQDLLTTAKATSKQLKAVPVFDWGENDFNFNVPVKIKGTEIDYIVEQGEKNGWYYRKWNGGFAECWYSGNVTVDVGANYLDGYYHSGSKSINYPFTMARVLYGSVDGGSTGNMNIVRVFNYTLTSISYIVLGQADVSSANVRLNIYVVGQWR